MSVRDVDGLNVGYAQGLLEQYLENPEAVPEEWRSLFESGDSAIVEALPGLARLLENLKENGAPAQAEAPPEPSRPTPEPRCSRAIEAPPAAAAGTGRRRRARRRRRCGDDVDQGDPHARPPRREPRSTRLGARRRPGARGGAARAAADARAAGSHPRLGAARRGRRRDARRRPAEAPGDLLRDDRVRDRAHLGPPGARVAATRDRVRPLSGAVERRRAAQPPRAADRGRGVRALPQARVPRTEAVLDRGSGRDGSDARRSRRARRRVGRPRSRDRHGAPRAAQRPRTHHRATVRGAPARVRGRAHHRGDRRERGRGERRRQVPPREPSAVARRRPATRRCSSPRTRATSRPSIPSSRASREPSRPIARPAWAPTTRRWRCRS